MNKLNNVEIAVFLTNGWSKLLIQRLQSTVSSENRVLVCGNTLLNRYNFQNSVFSILQEY